MPSSDVITRLRAAAPAILPSLLLCDFGNLQREVALLEEAGVAGLHLDVMDGHFVPNLTYGLPVVEAVDRLTDLPLDVHLMIDRPEQFVEQFISAGADIVTIHAEAVDDPRPVLEQIRASGAASGLAINPPTLLADVERALPVCDLLLVMSVMPGFGGQQFDGRALEKLSEAKQRGEVLLEVDGGVNNETVRSCVEAGAELLVVGSAIFRSGDYDRSVARLCQLATLH